MDFEHLTRVDRQAPMAAEERRLELDKITKTGSSDCRRGMPIALGRSHLGASAVISTKAQRNNRFP